MRRTRLGNQARLRPNCRAEGLLVACCLAAAGLFPVECIAAAAAPASGKSRAAAPADSEKPSDSREKAAARKPADAQQQITAKKSRQNSTTRGAGRQTLSPATEQAAIAFATEHHAELLPLLEKLRKSRPRQYRQAVVELSRTSDRFTRLRKNVPSRYDASLQAWKLDSRIRLLAARMTMTDDPGQAEELRVLLGERLEVRRQELLLEQQRLTRRLDQVQQLLDRLNGDPDEMVEREFRRVERLLQHRGRPTGRKAGEQRKSRQIPVVAPRPR